MLGHRRDSVLLHKRTSCPWWWATLKPDGRKAGWLIQVCKLKSISLPHSSFHICVVAAQLLQPPSDPQLTPPWAPAAPVASVQLLMTPYGLSVDGFSSAAQVSQQWALSNSAPAAVGQCGWMTKSCLCSPWMSLLQNHVNQQVFPHLVLLAVSLCWDAVHARSRAGLENLRNGVLQALPNGVSVEPVTPLS